MADLVDQATRSRMMAGIQAKNTRPEIVIRKLLHRLGFRFRIHDRKLPGNPDLVLRKYGAVILVHGCFWHGHDCPLFRWPATRIDFWKTKIERNKENDRKVKAALKNAGWRIGTVWECAMKGPARYNVDELGEFLGPWLRSEKRRIEVRRKAS